MNYIKVKLEDHILHILFDRGKSNAMDLDMLKELLEVIKEAKVNPAIEGMVLSGKEHFFSSGLDLITLYNYDECQMEKFWRLFIDLTKELVSFPKPTVAAITGHSPAGGCVLAICCDYRIMAEGDYIVGLNEVPVGIIVPPSIFTLYSFWLGTAVAYRSLLEGKLYKPNEALAIGLVDDVVPLMRIQNAALRQVKSLTQYEKNAWQATKINLRKELIAALSVDHNAIINQMVDQWWKPTTRSIMKTIIDNLTQKKG
ncbi:enoyl-CoA hydratase/isomerase family protein [Sphingobacterium rhinopitheci]|uniref:enoyl-CoA hydratase/isomerase family protein n=1 Tax=Sphingobacterium rhinopitheci TaxID=2781960 RepID=UPI001F5181F4|nr:enoyl-CoA hydratase/isomerase family protein [Sphingobacterium rhinopitheci]MCI0921591.1 enoyl-CoA hydratase/isomerase family protein [Sphingobacterium rhinopitheci]